MDTCCCCMSVLELFFLSSVDFECFGWYILQISSWHMWLRRTGLPNVRTSLKSMCFLTPSTVGKFWSHWSDRNLCSDIHCQSLAAFNLLTCSMHTSLRDFWILCHLLPTRTAHQWCYRALQTLSPVIAHNWHNLSENSEHVVIWLADKMLNIAWQCCGSFVGASGTPKLYCCIRLPETVQM